MSCALCGMAIIVGANLLRCPEDSNVAEAKLETENSYDKKIDETEKVYTIWSENCFAFDITDPAKMAENSQYVSLVKIDSLDEVDNYSELHQSYTMPYTRGRMTVIENLKGELPLGEELRFYRMGGAIAKDKYYKALEGAERERFSYAMEHNAELSEADKVEVFGPDEVRLEEGKIYLVYMFDETFIDGEAGTYGIHSFKGGVREVKFDATKVGLGALIEQAEVLNNFTGEWEELSKVVEQSGLGN